MVTSAQVKATATRAGYTRRVIVEVGAQDLYGYVKPNFDPESAFSLIDQDDGTVFRVKGWDATVRDLDD